ncbi:hypothetical protein EJD97_023496 [Solanum chilense]|uniref:GATA-type domain-containing protein n=1 Tax=Solanum chilense TaxID=4083 RepID=A0A6N2C528_SOLCI|nr:hypothetical protein EJD97_023496 [Solanum chilense]
MDLKEVKRSKEAEAMKSCSYCHTTTTPLWRSGPSGPKSLCNACGIKYNKKRRQILGVEKKRRIEKKSIEIGKLMGFGGKLREEEQAAILLMALSCGSVGKLLF